MRDISRGANIGGLTPTRATARVTTLYSTTYTSALLGIIPTRATARVTTPHQPYPRPYNDYGGSSSWSFMARLFLVFVSYSPTRFTRRKRRGLSLLCVLGGLLLLLPLLVPSVALASSTDTNTKSLPVLSPQGVLDLAGVSVVRLEVSYRPPGHTSPVVTCTALGTLLASWPANSPTEQNNWVLTDGSMLALDGGSCVSGDTLASITILASNEFTNQMPSFTMLDQLNCQSSACSDQPVGSSAPIAETISRPVNGGILLSFHSDASHMLPYLTVAPSSSSASPNGIELATASGPGGTWPAAPKILSSSTNLQDYLTPKLGNATAGNLPPSPGVTVLSNEPGMPFVDSNGQLTSMQLSGKGNQLKLADIQNLYTQEPLVQQALQDERFVHNTLNRQWNVGIRQYEQGDYTDAVQTLASIESLNPSFQAPKVFAQLAMAKIPHGNNGTHTPPPPSGNGQGSSNFLGIPMWLMWLVGSVAAVMVLILLFVLVSLVLGRWRAALKQDRQELRRFKAEEVEARRIADAVREARRVSEREKPQPAPNIPCPNCGQPVRAGATFCPNCRYVISPATLDARPNVQTLPMSEAPASGRVPTPPDRIEPQPAQVKQDDLSIRGRLERLWDRVDS